MDVDPPLPHPSLKRSCSAPMISDCDSTIATIATSTVTTTTVVSTSSARASPTFMLYSAIEPRTRRFSASFSPLPSPGSPCIPSRVSQLKQEEACDIVVREVASEKDFQSALQISQSWEDLTLSDSDVKDTPKEVKRPSSACTEPIHVSLPTGLSSLVSSPYPSPTRVGSRQCFSPSMQIAVRNNSFSPTPSPSPTRKSFYTSRRSLSPIAIRPSPFGAVKRKCDMEDRNDHNWNSAKKFHWSPANGGPLLLTQTATNSLDHADNNGSLPSTAVPTPESGSLSSSIDSPAPFKSAGSPGDSNSSGRVRLIPTRAVESSDDLLPKRKDFSRLFVPIPPSPECKEVVMDESDDTPSAPQAMSVDSSLSPHDHSGAGI